MSILRHKEYLGSIEVDPAKKLLYGKLLYITETIAYQAYTVVDLEREFKKSVDKYIDSFTALNQEPSKPYSGIFNLKISKELHKDTALHAALNGVSINEFIKLAIQDKIQNQEEK